MGLNKQKGNMYNFVTHTWNPIKGKCSHGCSYCYMHRWKLPEVHLDEKEFKTKLGSDKVIFVGSGTDIFANDIPDNWIQKVIEFCKDSPGNKYLFQTKNPSRYHDFDFTDNFVLGTTIETNRWYEDIKGLTPSPISRANDLEKIKNKKFVTIEPILDFDLDIFVQIIMSTEPTWVNIGADSCGHKLPEPSSEKIKSLVEFLKGHGIKVHLKSTLDRLLTKGEMEC